MSKTYKTGDGGNPDAPQTAENVCPRCGRSGVVANATCDECNGSGYAAEIVGDA